MLPYPIQIKLDRLKAKYYLRTAAQLPPLVLPQGNLAAEVHMMLGRHDLLRALAALQTFYHHSGLSDRVGLTLHMDGTVTEQQRRWMEERVRGAAFTDYPSQDVRLLALFRGRPKCEEYYRRNISCMPKLFHVPAFARTDRVIVMDTDVAFYSRPDVIVDWVDRPASPPRYMISGSPGEDPGECVREVFRQVCDCIGKDGTRLTVRDYYFNSGLILFPVSRWLPELVDRYFNWHSFSEWRNAKGLFWFSDWTVEQTAVMLNFAAWPDAQPLDTNYACGDAPALVCNHYMSIYYYRKAILGKIRNELLKIGRPPSCSS